ncbi:MAG: hypothetical protein ABSB91_01915 [Sedimentisphaerales bacterium]|jgi:hypothetical protein
MPISAKKIVQILYKILMIPFGALVGGVLIYIVESAFHTDVPVYLTMGFVIMVPLVITQSLSLMLIFFIFARLVKMKFLFSASNNFIISIIFSILYNIFFAIINVIEQHLHHAIVFEHELLICLLILPAVVFILVVTCFIWLQSKLLHAGSQRTEK